MTLDERMNSYLWKGKKKYLANGTIEQDIIKLIDANEDQLQSFYTHSYQMLYNDDVENPGRYPLLELVKVQRDRCGAELFVRYLRKINQAPNTYLMSLRNLINNNVSDDLTRESLEKLSISSVQDDCPPEFEDLTIDIVMDACLDKLGKFDKSHITLSFILKQGLWFTDAEFKDLTEKDSDGRDRDRRDVVKERLLLKPNTKVILDPKGLTFTQFRAMIGLKSKKYADFTTDQLTTLRDKLLFALEDDILHHISEWEARLNQIKKVAQYKGYSLKY